LEWFAEKKREGANNNAIQSSRKVRGKDQSVKNSGKRIIRGESNTEFIKGNQNLPRLLQKKGSRVEGRKVFLGLRGMGGRKNHNTEREREEQEKKKNGNRRVKNPKSKNG